VLANERSVEHGKLEGFDSAHGDFKALFPGVSAFFFRGQMVESVDSPPGVLLTQYRARLDQSLPGFSVRNDRKSICTFCQTLRQDSFPSQDGHGKHMARAFRWTREFVLFDDTRCFVGFKSKNQVFEAHLGSPHIGQLDTGLTSACPIFIPG